MQTLQNLLPLMVVWALIGPFITIAFFVFGTAIMPKNPTLEKYVLLFLIFSGGPLVWTCHLVGKYQKPSSDKSG